MWTCDAGKNSGTAPGFLPAACGGRVGLWTVLTGMTVLTGLTADIVDLVDSVHSVGCQHSAFLRVPTSEPIKDTSEIKRPEAGKWLEGTAEQPYARSAPSSPPPLLPLPKPGGEGGPSDY